MITSIHVLVYSDDAEATRQFFADVLGWPSVLYGEPGDGWLIFRTGLSEVGVHPTFSVWEGKEYRHEVPGADPIQLYQPSHPTAFDL